MIPCWFLPYAIAYCNPFILEASERTPRTATMLFEPLDELDIPPGVVNLVHGGQGTAEALIDHPDVRAISFVGSTPAARAVYARAAAAGKRVQAQSGAKNALVLLPDAPIERVAAIAAESARVVVDGRNASVDGLDGGFFVGATVLDPVPAGGTLATTEVFGPVLGIQRVQDFDDAIALVNSGRFGNMACLFTGSGGAARRFRNEAQVGNVGVNVGVAQPMASFPFSGWDDSFFGDLHAHGHHAVEFFTQTKVVVERWP